MKVNGKTIREPNLCTSDSQIQLFLALNPKLSQAKKFNFMKISIADFRPTLKWFDGFVYSIDIFLQSIATTSYYAAFLDYSGGKTIRNHIVIIWR